MYVSLYIVNSRHQQHKGRRVRVIVLLIGLTRRLRRLIIIVIPQLLSSTTYYVHGAVGEHLGDIIHYVVGAMVERFLYSNYHSNTQKTRLKSPIIITVVTFLNKFSVCTYITPQKRLLKYIPSSSTTTQDLFSPFRFRFFYNLCSAALY